MSTQQVSDVPGGETPDMRHVHAGGARWRREQNELKKRQLKADLADARRRAAELGRNYSRAFERAAHMPERRGATAVGVAFDEADRAMNRLIATQAEITHLESLLKATR